MLGIRHSRTGLLVVVATLSLLAAGIPLAHQRVGRGSQFSTQATANAPDQNPKDSPVPSTIPTKYDPLGPKPPLAPHYPPPIKQEASVIETSVASKYFGSCSDPIQALVMYAPTLSAALTMTDIVAKVTVLSPTEMSDPDFVGSALKIRVDQTLWSKGRQTDPEPVVLVQAGERLSNREMKGCVAEEPVLVPGNSYVLFLSEWNGRWYVSQGKSGAFSIDNGTLRSLEDSYHLNTLDLSRLASEISAMKVSADAFEGSRQQDELLNRTPQSTTTIAVVGDNA